MENEMDVIITDSPLILTHFYGLKYDPFEQKYNTSLKMLEQHHAINKHYGYKVEHIFLNRVKPYNPAGRNESEDKAKQYDEDMKDMLRSLGIKFDTFDANKNAADEIFKKLVGKYNDCSK